MTNDSPKKIVISYLIFCIVFTAVIMAMIFISNFLLFKAVSVDQGVISDTQGKPVVIIDAGHGGEDGGAIGKNGIYEKDVNLIITNDLADMLKAAGVEVIMTRSEDVLLYDRSADFKGRKKMLDLAARLRIANETENAIFVSIHMNSFPIEKYDGLQVYYSKNTAKSRLLAESIQSSVKEHLQSNNDRSIKEAGSNIYLLDRCQSTSVLVECGFLSNTAECDLLSTEEYQKELSLAIFSGIYSYLIEISS